VSRKVQRPAGMLVLAGMASGAVFVLVSLLGPMLLPLIPDSHYLHLHVLIELAAVLVAFAIFIVNWESTKQSRNSQSLFIATGFLAVAALDTMHILSSPGMPPFLGSNTVDRSQYYWLAGRLWSAGILLVAASVRPDCSGILSNRRALLSINGAVSLVVLLAVPTAQSILPALYTAGGELASVGMLAGFAIIGLSLAAVAAHMRVYRSTRDEAGVFVIAALIISTFSGMAFTLLPSHELYILLGHSFTVAAHYLLFKGLLVSAVRRPYTQLKLAKDRLERTVAELDARNQELDALDEVAVTLNSSLKLDAVLDAAIEKVMKVMQASGGAIFLSADGTGGMKLAAWRGLTSEAVRECLSTPSDLPLNQLSPEGDLSITTLEDPALVRSLGGLSARIAPLRACICAPVASKGRTLGVLVVVAGEDRTFSPRDADLLTAMGYQLGLAVENSWLYERTDERLREKLEELQRAERRSRFLSEVGAILASSMELGQVLDLLARKSTEVVGDWCSIYLLNEREKVLYLAAIHYEDEEDMRTIRQIISRSPVKLGDGLIGRVAESGEAVLAPEVSPDEFTAEVRWLAHSIQEIAVLRNSAPTSWIVAPMRARGRTVGVLTVMVTHSKDRLCEAELSLVSALADRAGVAVENSILFQESQAQRRHLEAVISQMVDGVVIVDEEARILIANSSARRMLGQDLDRLTSAPRKTSEARAAGIRRPRRWGPPLARRALAGELVMGEELTVASDQRERILSASASSVRDASGEVAGAVVVLRDVTAEREVERMKEEFVATVSHELRTPITAILGYSDILLRGLRGPLAPKQEEALNAVRAGGHRLLLIVNDLLDMSKLESGKQQLVLARVDLPLVISRVLSAMGLLASSKGVAMTSQLPYGLPDVHADEEQLQRIFGNLLSNAIKFTPEGGNVTVTAEPLLEKTATPDSSPSDGAQQVRFVVVRISDTGVGVPPEHHERIWDKFHQVDSSSRRAFGGTGLGLAITKSLVELHGGRVRVDSEGVAGRGSVFSFTLPVAPPPPGA
jgi:PAS domain S-box-containing protein